MCKKEEKKVNPPAFNIYLDVLEGVVHEAAVAAVVAEGPWTVDEVLLAQRDEFAGLAEVLAF